MLQKIKNNTDGAWLHLTAAVFWLAGASLFSAASTIKCNDHPETAAQTVSAERLELLTAHDCEEHMKLRHTELGEEDDQNDLAEIHRNRDHRKLCNDLKQRVRDLALKKHVVSPRETGG